MAIEESMEPAALQQPQSQLQQIMNDDNNYNNVVAYPPLADKEGYLEKEGGNVKSWRLRWFVLIGQTLSYYRHRGDDKPAGSVDLAGAEIIDVDDFFRKRKHEYLFQIKIPARTYNIIAPDFDTRRAWIEILDAKAKLPPMQQQQTMTRSTSRENLIKRLSRITAPPAPTTGPPLSPRAHTVTANGTMAINDTGPNTIIQAVAGAITGIPTAPVPITQLSPRNSKGTSRNDSDDEQEDDDSAMAHLLAQARKKSDTPPDLKPIHRLIGERCIGCKAQIEDLLYCAPEKLISVLKECLERINILMNDCYYFTSLELDKFREQTVMKHCVNIEASFKDVIFRAKTLAVQHKTNSSTAEINTLQEELHTTVYGLLSILDQLRADNASMEAALISAEIFIPTKTMEYRHSMARASRNLEAAMDELEKFSSSSSSSSSSGMSPMVLYGSASVSLAAAANRISPLSIGGPSPRTSPRTGPGRRLSPGATVLVMRSSVYVEPPSTATLIPAASRNYNNSNNSNVLPPRSRSDKSGMDSANRVDSDFRLPPRAFSVPTVVGTSSGEVSRDDEEKEEEDDAAKTSQPIQRLPSSSSSSSQSAVDTPTSTTTAAEMRSFDVLADIVDAITQELSSSIARTTAAALATT